MTQHHTIRLLALACLAATAAAPALAQDSNYYYFGLSAGPSQAKTDGRAIVDSQLPAGVVSSGISVDRRDTAYRAFLGYQMTPYWALEGGYFRLGELSFTSTTTPAGTLAGRLRSEGLNLDLVGSLPVTERLSVLGRVGAQHARTRGEIVGTGAALLPNNPNPSGRSTNYKAGLGLQYAFSPGFMMRLEAERYRVDDAMGHKGFADAALVSVVFPFGRAPTSAPMRMSSTPYVAPAAAPAPTPMPAPMVISETMTAPAPAPAPVLVAAVQAPAPLAPPPRQRVSFTAESMFGFDASAVQPEGRSALDAFAGKLAGTQFDQITVEGHTDRLGTEAYNQQLSQRRADAVKAYLVADGKVDGGKITAKGLGEGSPVTQTADCKDRKGHAPSAQLIACLQPDRRVDIEVTGSR